MGPFNCRGVIWQKIKTVWPFFYYTIVYTILPYKNQQQMRKGIGQFAGSCEICIAAEGKIHKNAPDRRNILPGALRRGIERGYIST